MTNTLTVPSAHDGDNPGSRDGYQNDGFQRKACVAKANRLPQFTVEYLKTALLHRPKLRQRSVQMNTS